MDAGVGYLAQALKINDSITILNIAANNFYSDGGRYLGGALKENTTLTEINIKLNEIGEKGIASIKEGLDKNITLIKIDLGEDKKVLDYSQINEHLKSNQWLKNENDNASLKPTVTTEEALKSLSGETPDGSME